MPHYCFINRVREDALAEYKEAHAAVWPEMLAALRDAGWRNYRLYLSPDGLLVGHFEADDYDAAQRQWHAPPSTRSGRRTWSSSLPPRDTRTRTSTSCRKYST